MTLGYFPSLTSPLDDLIDRLGGPGSVAEMTGRKGRLVRVGGDRVQYELRDSGGSALESLNNQEVQLLWNIYSSL